jgi:2'-5' RNA ligase
VARDRLAVVAYPTLDEADRRWIEAFRAEHDPHAARLPAHFTLAFPAEAPDGAMEREAATAALSTRPVLFAIRRVEVIRDALGAGFHVFLVPDEGGDMIAALHDRLYEASLQPYLRSDIPFVPHVTIGAAPDLPSAERLASQLDFGSRVVRGSISSIDVVDVGLPRVRTVRTFPLTGG